MYESPQSLQNICLDILAGNIISLTDDKENDANKNFSFEKLDAVLHCDLSEQLLHVLSKKKYLNDRTISIFDPRYTRLEKVKINNASQISIKGLKYLKPHKIKDLEVTDLEDDITVNDLISCLGDWTLQNIRTLNVRNNSFTSHQQFCVIVCLSKLRSLKSLNVSNTEFNGHGLEIVAEDLPCLENLDISETKVKDISPLELCKDRLRSLSMYNLKIFKSPKYIQLICSMKNLRHLDISNDKDHPLQIYVHQTCSEALLFKNYTALPHLISLDVSGKDKIDAEDLRVFLEHHPSLRFLGLCETEVCHDDFFTKHPSELYVTGSATEAQVLRCLESYPNRPSYIQRSLYHLHSYTQLFNYHFRPRIDVIKLVLSVLAGHPKVLSIQMAGTACLYCLIRSTRGQGVPLPLLGHVVDLTLAAMDNFPVHQQLNKNALLTLCSDRILQDVPFDRYRCARLVMDSLVCFQDHVMNKLSVAICSILAARISTVETSRLGILYMKKLLDIVESKVRQGDLDIMLKFTFSALWNLTDESPETCGVFLNCGGLELFLRILKEFPQEFTIETKVLGLINNIGEVKDLRPSLLRPDFVSILRQLISSDNIDASYFAAGILSHLCSDTDLDWGTAVDRSALLDLLGKVVTQWKFPDMEMVAYRSFNPFVFLLQPGQARQVQVWAVWAISHVCSKNPKRYVKMLVDEGIVNLLQPLAAPLEDFPLLATLALDILQLVSTCN